METMNILSMEVVTCSQHRYAKRKELSSSPEQV